MQFSRVFILLAWLIGAVTEGVAQAPVAADSNNEAPVESPTMAVEVERLQRRVSALHQELDQLRRHQDTLDNDNFAPRGLVVFLFGAFCALWARNSGRSGTLWFFLGLFFSVITVLVLLWKNHDDQKKLEAEPA